MSGTDRISSALDGRYRLERQLGAGGMATVYLAHDIKHDRKVALKVLRPELAAVVGADRFLAEIRTTANLQHPHILALFDSGQIDGTVFYVMPYVDGESLRDRIMREKQLPIEDALRIAREVGDALQYAHGHGVIHRDIKPENILLQGGHAQVADFGIALAASKTGGSRMTETGMSLGTPRYMSPEQAMGDRTIDARTDVYALGCVLYEMLTGDAPFTGSTAQAIMAKVLTEKPARILTTRERVPPHVEDAVLTALEKLPADRFATAAEFVAAISGASGATSASTRARSSSRSGSGFRVPGSVLVGIIGVVVVAAVGGWFVGRGARVRIEAPSRLSLLEPGSPPVFNGVSRVIDLSADGQTIVYSAAQPLGSKVLVRRLDGTQPRELPNSSNTFNLRLTPDGRTLYAGQIGGQMQHIPLAGGSWASAGGILDTPFLNFSPDGTLWWGSPNSYNTLRRGVDGRDSVIFSRSLLTQVLPGGRFGIGVGVTTGSNTGTAQWFDLRTGAIKTIFEPQIVDIKYTLGYIVYVRPDGVLVAASFDAKSGTVTGAHIEVANSVMVTGAGFAQFAVADNGTVAFVPGSQSELVRVARSGDQRVLLSEPRRYHSPRISPDSRRIAFDDINTDGRDVWLYSEGVKDITRATFQRDGHDAVWSLDGHGLYYLGGNGGKLDIFHVQLSTSTPARPLGTRVELAHTGTPLPGGGFVTTTPGPAGRGSDIVRLSEDGTKVDTLVGTSADESFVVPSHDGRWLAYTSDQSGRPEVYVRAVSGSDALLQVSSGGATEPVWSRDGREIFYRRATPKGAELVAATLELGPEPRVIKRTALFDVSGFDTATPHADYDVSPDGTWFVFARRGGSDHIVILQNLPELARRIAATGATP